MVERDCARLVGRLINGVIGKAACLKIVELKIDRSDKVLGYISKMANFSA